jgi:hypothetical protein
MSTLDLGISPDTLTVHLSPGADFESTLVLLDDDGAEQDWPVGTVITLRFAKSAAADVTWTATITDAEATFDVDKAAVDSLLAENREKVRLYYVNGTDDLLWASGKVAVHA